MLRINLEQLLQASDGAVEVFHLDHGVGPEVPCLDVLWVHVLGEGLLCDA